MFKPLTSLKQSVLDLTRGEPTNLVHHVVGILRRVDLGAPRLDQDRNAALAGGQIPRVGQVGVC